MARRISKNLIKSLRCYSARVEIKSNDFIKWVAAHPDSVWFKKYANSDNLKAYAAWLNANPGIDIEQVDDFVEDSCNFPSDTGIDYIMSASESTRVCSGSYGSDAYDVFGFFRVHHDQAEQAEDDGIDSIIILGQRRAFMYVKLVSTVFMDTELPLGLAPSCYGHDEKFEEGMAEFADLPGALKEPRYFLVQDDCACCS